MTSIILKQQRGMALVFVVFVVALIAVLASAMISDQFVQIRMLDNHLKLSRQLQHAYGIEAWGIEVLKRDQQTAGTVDHLQEDWGRPLETTTLEDKVTQVRGWITDLNGQIDINRLVQQGKANTIALSQAKQFANNLEVEAALFDILADWMDDDIQTQGSGAESPYYTGLKPAYHNPNQPLAHISEAAYIKDMNGEQLYKLSQAADALPQLTPVNLNTANAAALAMALPGLSYEDASALQQLREQQPWQSVDDFISQLKNNTGMNDAQIQQIDKTSLAVTSQFFLVTSEVLMDEQIFQMHSRIYRDPAGGMRVYERRLQYLQ